MALLNIHLSIINKCKHTLHEIEKILQEECPCCLEKKLKREQRQRKIFVDMVNHHLNPLNPIERIPKPWQKKSMRRS